VAAFAMGLGMRLRRTRRDLYINISDARFLNSVENMTSDHGTTAADSRREEKIPPKSRQNGWKKKNLRRSSDRPLTRASRAVYS